MSVPVAELLDHTRAHILRDAVAPVLFSDDSLVQHMNDAYKRFARRTHCFVDLDAVITTVAGTHLYDLPEDTIYLREAFCDDRHMTPYTRRAKPSRILNGRPVAYTTDAPQRTVRLYPTPDKEYQIALERAVTPATIDIDSEIDLDDEWAYLLCQWVAYMALSNNDPDGSRTIEAEDFYKRWGVGLREAKMDFTRQWMGDNPSAQPRKWT